MIVMIAFVCLLIGLGADYFPTWRTRTATLGEKPVSLEIAESPAEQERGLMYRKSLPEDHGMLFLFSPPRIVNFWMYHTLIPLDLLLIRDDRIIKIFHNVPPCESENSAECPRYGGIEVSEVLELNGGYCNRHQVKEGEPIKFDRWFRRHRMAELLEPLKRPFRPALRAIRSR
jgi:uncharacterized membrane protein (UPF0127 family)